MGWIGYILIGLGISVIAGVAVGFASVKTATSDEAARPAGEALQGCADADLGELLSRDDGRHPQRPDRPARAILERRGRYLRVRWR